MALQSFDGALFNLIGPLPDSSVSSTTIVLDAANEAAIYIGRVVTSDGGSHTIDTSGSSSLGWRSGTLTFANGSTTVKVGLAAVLDTAGPPAQASHASDVITFDVSKSLTGGGGGITASAWQTHVPDTGTKTVANGDLIAFAIQMTARGGTDAVRPTMGVGTIRHRPNVTSFVGGAYANVTARPNAIITFSDGALGYFHASDVLTTINTRQWNSGSATKEYGQLFQLPFPTKIYGIWGYVAPTADFDAVLYSDPLGTPVAEKSVVVDANTVSSTATGRFYELFSAPYTTAAGQIIAAVFKPGGSNIDAYYKTLASSTHRISDIGGTDSYGISRASGAFADANSSLDHYYIGLIVGAFDDSAGIVVSTNTVAISDVRTMIPY